MAAQEIRWQVPEGLYRELVCAQHEMAYPSLTAFVSQAVKRYLAEVQHEAWRREFRQLQHDVRATGGFGLGETKEDVIARLREQRRQIFDTDYAHLY